jgi:hypothetical protein
MSVPALAIEGDVVHPWPGVATAPESEPLVPARSISTGQQLHGPPQSTPASPWFCTPSEQVAAAQVFWAVHTLLAQSPPTLHSTHSPALVPLGSAQTFPPPKLHVVPRAFGVCVFVPLEQPPVWQSSWFAGVSASSAMEVVAPLPSQTTLRQSPAVCTAIAVLAATSCVPQQPLLQVRATHSLPVSGQSPGTPQVVPPSHAAPEELLLLDDEEDELLLLDDEEDELLVLEEDEVLVDEEEELLLLDDELLLAPPPPPLDDADELLLLDDEDELASPPAPPVAEVPPSSPMRSWQPVAKPSAERATKRARERAITTST